MKVAVVLTTYNQEKYIERTIESVLAQNFFDWELFVWDDASHDATFDILVSYEQRDKRIHIFQSHDNLGIVWNMNSLISKIPKDYPYIAFLEWDDMLTPESLSKRVEVLESYQNIDLVYSDVALIDADDTVIVDSYYHSRGIRMVQHDKLSKLEYLLQIPTVVLSYSSIMLRWEALRRIGGIPNPLWDKFYSVSDYDLCYKLMTHGYAQCITIPLTLYRKHATNFSGSGGRIYRDMLALLEHYMNTNIIDAQLYNKKIALIHILEIRNLLWFPNCFLKSMCLLWLAFSHDGLVLFRSRKFILMIWLIFFPTRFQKFILKSVW